MNHPYLKLKSNKLYYLYPYCVETETYQSKFSTKKNKSLNNITFPILWQLNYDSLYHSIEYNAFEVIDLKKIKQKYAKERQKSFVSSELLVESIITYTDPSSLIYLKLFFFYFRLKYRFFLEETNAFEERNTLIYYKYNQLLKSSYIWHLIYQDPILEKFINLFTKKGNKSIAENMILKSIQFLSHIFKYQKKKIRKKKRIHLIHPLIIIKQAIDNVQPRIKATNIPFGRRTRIVPSPIHIKNQIKLSIRSIIEEANKFTINKPFYYKFTLAILNAYQKKGDAYDRMVRLHQDAFELRAYLSFNYYLRSKKARKNLKII